MYIHCSSHLLISKRNPQVHPPVKCEWLLVVCPRDPIGLLKVTLLESSNCGNLLEQGASNYSNIVDKSIGQNALYLNSHTLRHTPAVSNAHSIHLCRLLIFKEEECDCVRICDMRSCTCVGENNQSSKKRASLHL